jgi:hypothetical protein
VALHVRQPGAAVAEASGSSEQLYVLTPGPRRSTETAQHQPVTSMSECCLLIYKSNSLINTVHLTPSSQEYHRQSSFAIIKVGVIMF